MEGYRHEYLFTIFYGDFLLGLEFFIYFTQYWWFIVSLVSSFVRVDIYYYSGRRKVSEIGERL